MDWLQVKNWNKYQHYKQRNPPWIKLHISILNDRAFSALSLASKGLLMQAWILASENEGKIPANIEELRFRFRDKTIKQVDLNLLIEKGFLYNCKQPLASASIMLAGACLETETETETEKEKEKEIYKEKSLPILDATKDKYKDYVFLTKEEHERLLKDFGSNRLEKMIEILDNYIGAAPKKRNTYTDHNRVLRGWVAEKTEEIKQKSFAERYEEEHGHK